MLTNYMKHDTTLFCKMHKAKEHYIKNVNAKLDDLPALFNVSISTVYKHAAKEKWASTKRQLWSGVSKEQELAARKSLTLDLAGALISKALLEVDALYKEYRNLEVAHSLAQHFTLERVTNLIREGNIQRATNL